MITPAIKILCDNIIIVYSKKDKNVYYEGKFYPILFKHMYSSSKNETVRLKINDNILPIGDLIVKYKCPSCASENDILLKKFLTKITTKCIHCKEDEDKRKTQSIYVKSSFAEFGKLHRKVIEKKKKLFSMSSNELIELSNKSFDKETSEFKNIYFNSIPTIDEFSKIKNKIKIENINMNSIEYYPHILTNHSHKYSPKILDENGKLHLLSSVTYICDSCGVEFNGRYFKYRSSQHKVLCRSCIFCNKSFKIRYTKNIKGDKIRYQSNPELDLINYCNINSVLIENGPLIKYEFENKIRTYFVDFRIRNILIEVKDDHIWHKNDILSGKWKAKEDAAKEYCKINKLEYKLIMKKDVVNLKDYIVRFNWII